MSQQVAIFATVKPAPGKLNRLREVIIQAIEWIEANEPETLEFSLYEEDDGDSTALSMSERYASHAAMIKHESSGNYKKLFQTIEEEELLQGPPVISKGIQSGGFRR